LAKMFAKPSNVLVLDEPTNDLDIDTLDLLEEFLLNYTGTVLIVSHDREFLNNVVTSIFAFEGDGCIKEYVGGYNDWLRQSIKIQEILQKEEKDSSKKDRQKQPENSHRKLSYKEKKELGEIPQLIEKLEAEQKQLHDEMMKPDFYKNSSDVAAVNARLKDLSKQLEDAYARWQLLDELQS